MPQKKTEVTYLTVDPNEQGQRLDNYLLARLKGLPRSRVYRIIRSGEVRINKGRAKPSSRLSAGDQVRVPPVSQSEQRPGELPEAMLQRLREAVLHHDDEVLVLNKPAGLAVHAGSGVRSGLIDGVRKLWGERWQLVHRLDRETSGVLLLVARRELQHAFQQAQAEQRIEKDYLAVVHGQWPAQLQRIESQLERNANADGQRRVASGEQGRHAVSQFRIERSLRQASLMAIRIETGRTHQIRVQAAEAGHPLVGDDKYGRRERDRQLALSRRPGLCLHARRLCLQLQGQTLDIQCPPPAAMQHIIDELEPHR